MITATKNPRHFILDQADHLKLIGFIAIALPPILWIITKIAQGCNDQESISHYYYTVAGDVFVGFLCSIGTFMILYKGYERKDHIAANLAGACAFGVAWFPTDFNKDVQCSLFTLPNITWRINIHYISAAILFLTLAYMCLFLFTLSDKDLIDRSTEKRYRNNLYRTFGVLIIICVACIAIYHNVSAFHDWFGEAKMTLIWEWCATLSFGFAWLIKGGIVLKDK